jgi:hypothetical protein
LPPAFQLIFPVSCAVWSKGKKISYGAAPERSATCAWLDTASIAS